MPRVMMLAFLLAAIHAPPVFPQSEPLGLAWQLTYSFNMDNALSPDGGRMVFIRIMRPRRRH